MSMTVLPGSMQQCDWSAGVCCRWGSLCGSARCGESGISNVIMGANCEPCRVRLDAVCIASTVHRYVRTVCVCVGTVIRPRLTLAGGCVSTK